MKTLRFKNQPLSEVAQSLESEFGVKFQLQDCSDVKVNMGTILENTLQNLLDQTLPYYNLQYKVTDSGEILIKPEKDK